MSGMSSITDNVAFYPFSPGIPWQVQKGIVVPAISKNVWQQIILNKKVYVLCPGFLVEILLLILFNNTLIKNKVNINSYIVPKKYNSLLKHFNMKIKSIEENDENLFIEFERLREAVESFPSPIFMDRKNNIYFNSLFNYGETFDIKNNLQERNNESFWKQMLKNTCCFPYDNRFQWFDKDILKKYSKKIFNKYRIDSTKPYILIDNNYISYNTADMRVSIARTLASHQLKSLGATFGYKQYQCIVSSNKKEHHGYFANNTRIIPSWYDMDLFEWLVLMSMSSGIYSSDPNVYLSAALIGCERIFAGGNFDFGWELKDVMDITTINNGKKRKWIQKDEFDTSDIVGALI